MTKQERPYGIRRQLDLLGYRVDRLNPSPPRDTLIAKANEKTLSSPNALDGAERRQHFFFGRVRGRIGN